MPRVFFALQPLHAERVAIAAASRDLAAGDPVDSNDLHLTLCFLGAVAEDRLAALCEGASALQLAEWRCTLVAAERWARPRILCLLPEEGPDTGAIAALAQELRDMALGLGLRPDPRPFRPHLTVMRKVPSGDTAWPCPLAHALPLHARGFVLMQSLDDQSPRYRVLRSWLPATS